jgi:hypothetical protein
MTPVVVVTLDRLGHSLSDVIRTVETLTAAWCCGRLDSSRDNHTAMGVLHRARASGGRPAARHRVAAGGDGTARAHEPGEL